MGTIYDYNGNIILPVSDTEGLSDLLPNRLLIWHDEFDKPYIDTNKWGHLYGAGTSNDYMCYAKNIDKVANSGNGLVYRAIKDNPNTADGFTYSSAFIHTNNIFEFMYGRIEAKIKFPSTTPHHTTFWTLGANTDRKITGEFTPWDSTVGVKFPSCGEIDIAECDNGSLGARTHWSNGGFDTDSVYQTGGNIASLTSTPNDWHIYSCEWTSSTITFYVDGVSKGSWNTSNATVNGWNPFNHPHFLILNCIVALTGTPTWDIAETNVAWVRVYAPVGVSEFVEETAISIPQTASISVGERHWLGTPTFTPTNPSDMTVKWLSHNENIVTCYGGMLIGISNGTTYVQATSKHGYTSLCKVTVS